MTAFPAAVPPPPLAPDNAALVLIDHQVGTLQLVRNLDAGQVKRFTLALAKAAKILGMPVVLTSSQEERIQGPLMPELVELLPETFAARVKRGGIVDAWTDPDFKAAVEATGRRNLVMAGITPTSASCSRPSPRSQKVTASRRSWTRPDRRSSCRKTCPAGACRPVASC